MINFNEPIFVEKGLENINEVIVKNKRLNGDGEFTKKCSSWFEEKFHCPKVLMTTSCTHALEMAALLAGIEKGDEVIMPSFTFVSTANAFVLRGAKIKFVDIRPDTMNIDEKLIESAITSKTKMIVPVHYAGVACDMNTIMKIAENNNLMVTEDAAQGVMSTYNGKYLGCIGDFGTYSFHETKNYTMGEGGAIIINRNKYVADAEIIREKGTDRSRFFRGEVDKYSWVEMGSSYLPSELNVAYLYAQLEMAEEINNSRLNAWQRYYDGLLPLARKGRVQLPVIPAECKHNAHIFYIKVKNLQERKKLTEYLKKKSIKALFHYVPLHSSCGGQKYGEFVGRDIYTTSESDRLLRLPLFYNIPNEQIDYIIEKINEFFSKF